MDGWETALAGVLWVILVVLLVLKLLGESSIWASGVLLAVSTCLLGLAVRREIMGR